MEVERLYTKQPSRTIQQKRGGEGALEMVDNRPAGILQAMSEHPIQRAEDDEDTLQGKFTQPIQRTEDDSISNEITGTLFMDSTLTIKSNGRENINGKTFNKVRNALISSIKYVKNAIKFLMDPSNDCCIERIIFDMQTNEIRNSIIDNYIKIYKGLTQQNVKIQDIGKIEAEQGAKGYVNSFLGYKFGPIYTRLENNPKEMIFNIIHEASHRWANTKDLSYITNSWATYKNLILNIDYMHGINIYPIKDGFDNADCYALYAFEVSGIEI